MTIRVEGQVWPNEKKKAEILQWPIRVYHHRQWHPVGIREEIKAGRMKQVSYKDRYSDDPSNVWTARPEQVDLMTSDYLGTYEKCFALKALSPTQLEFYIQDGDNMYGDPTGWRCTWVVEVEDVFQYVDVLSAVKVQFHELCVRKRRDELKDAEEARYLEIGEELISDYIDRQDALSHGEI